MQYDNSIEMRASADTVFSFLTEPNKRRLWMGRNKRRSLDVIPGAQKVDKAVMDKTKEVFFEGAVILENNPPHKFHARIDNDYYTVEEDWTLEEKGDLTLVRYVADLHAKNWWTRLAFSPLLSGRGLKLQLERMKEVVEQSN